MRVEKPTQLWLSDPEVFAVNREKAHSDHRYYEREDQAQLDAEMALKKSLNGKWKFAYSINPAERIKEFYEVDYDCSKFAEIEVPGHIQCQCYDSCQYVNTMYPWDGHDSLRPPAVSDHYNPVGSYVKEFTMDEEWQ